MERGQFVTVAEWMERGTIMDYIESHHANRLELVCNLAFPDAFPLKCDASCTVQPRV